MKRELEYRKPFVLDMDGVVVAMDDGSGSNIEYDKSDDAFFMFKGETFLDAYADLAERFRPRRILEIGVYRGGGTVFLDRYFKPEMLVAVEYSPDRLPKLDRYVESRSLSRMSVYHGVDQKDVPHLTSILDRHFEDGLDLVVDDASHWYEETKASFETVMPYLRPGGWYVIEDWPWAHAAPWQERGNLWEDKPALSNLIFEILVAHASSGNLIDQIVFAPGLMYLRRGGLEIPRGDFQLVNYQIARGRAIPSI